MIFNFLFSLKRMSNYNNHWSSGNNTKNQINKLDEQQIYKIKDVEKF